MMKVFLGTRSLSTMNPAPVALEQIDVQLNCSPQARLRAFCQKIRVEGIFVFSLDFAGCTCNHLPCIISRP